MGIIGIILVSAIATVRDKAAYQDTEKAQSL